MCIQMDDWFTMVFVYICAFHTCQLQYIHRLWSFLPSLTSTNQTKRVREHIIRRLHRFLNIQYQVAAMYCFRNEQTICIFYNCSISAHLTSCTQLLYQYASVKAVFVRSGTTRRRHCKNCLNPIYTGYINTLNIAYRAAQLQLFVNRRTPSHL